MNAPEEGELVKPTVVAMASMDMWIHSDPSILKQGKTKHSEPAAVEDVEPEELMKKEVAKDPWEKRLKPISQDDCTRGGLPAWIVRSNDIQTNYLDDKTMKSSKNYGTIVVKSLWWPGSYNFYNNARTQMIYCGDGLKHE